MSESGLPGLPKIKTAAYWHTKIVKPRHNGVYFCLCEDGSRSYRLWEDGGWWFLGDDGTWHPNNSFSYWCDVVLPEIATVRIKDMAQA